MCVLLFVAGEKVKDILLKILGWLRVVIDDPVLQKAAWQLIHPYLKSKLDEEWLEIVHKAISGAVKHALRLLEASERKIKEVCEANRELMKKIRELGKECYPGILTKTAGAAVSGAAIGAGGGAVIGGPIGATIGAVTGVTVGAVAGFIVGAKLAVDSVTNKNK